MKISKFASVILVFMLLIFSTACAEPGGPNMTPPDDYDPWADSLFGLRATIGYGDIENDPMAHGLTAYANNSATPELGDNSFGTATLFAASSIALIGAVIAHQKAKAHA